MIDTANAECVRNRQLDALSAIFSDVNKDFTFKAKAKAKYFASKAKAKAKDLAFKAKGKDLTFKAKAEA